MPQTRMLTATDDDMAQAVGEAAALLAAGEVAGAVRDLMAEFWPGPLTIVLPRRAELPEIVTSGLPTVAVCQSASPGFRAIGKALGSPTTEPNKAWAGLHSHLQTLRLAVENHRA